jgi:peptidoglycan/LPS O-acetylase OafA/YrhL
MATAVLPSKAISRESARNPVLDGWRGIAILLVLVEHLQNDFLHRIRVYTGQHGVTIFFVLSGFLITGNLIREDSFSLKRFYVRRFFRLMPIAVAYLSFVAAADWILHKHMTSWPEILSCLTFWRNYFGASNSLATMHFWSLSIEEQFYLAWPVLMLWVGKRHMRAVAVAGIVSCSLWRYFHWGFYQQFPYYFRTEVRADALMVGCLMALLAEDARVQRFLSMLLRPIMLLCLGALVWGIARFPVLPPTIECICVGLLIAATARQSDYSRLIGHPILVTVGAMSYSIYVWQQIFIEMGFRRHVAEVLLLMTPIVAYCSYRFIEKPMQAFGRKISS